MAPWWKTSVLWLLLLVVTCGAAQAKPEQRTAEAASICSTTETQARANGLDPSFFARLLWRESLFDPHVVSPKGAQGIAQFMPGTAAKRGLSDPFDPVAAVSASAAYLAELKNTFGNIGLAAAAYNAGEQRVTDWLAGKVHLPDETRDYVVYITGHPAEEWRETVSEFAIPSIGPGSFKDNCVALAERRLNLAETHIASLPNKPWGAVVAVNFSESTAVAMFRRLKLRFPAEFANREPLILRKRNLSRGSRRLVYVMLGETTRAAAETSCSRLASKGAPCLVRKN